MVGVALEEAAAERVEQDDRDPLALPLAGEQPLDRGGDDQRTSASPPHATG